MHPPNHQLCLLLSISPSLLSSLLSPFSNFNADKNCSNIHDSSLDLLCSLMNKPPSVLTSTELATYEDDYVEDDLTSPKVDGKDWKTRLRTKSISLPVQDEEDDDDDDEETRATAREKQRQLMESSPLRRWSPLVRDQKGACFMGVGRAGGCLLGLHINREMTQKHKDIMPALNRRRFESDKSKPVKWICFPATSHETPLVMRGRPWEMTTASARDSSARRLRRNQRNELVEGFRQLRAGGSHLGKQSGSLSSVTKKISPSQQPRSRADSHFVIQ